MFSKFITKYDTYVSFTNKKLDQFDPALFHKSKSSKTSNGELDLFFFSSNNSSSESTR